MLRASRQGSIKRDKGIFARMALENKPRMAPRLAMRAKKWHPDWPCEPREEHIGQRKCLNPVCITVISNGPDQTFKELLEPKKQRERGNGQVLVVFPICPVDRNSSDRQQYRSGGVTNLGRKAHRFALVSLALKLRAMGSAGVAILAHASSRLPQEFFWSLNTFALFSCQPSGVHRSDRLTTAMSSSIFRRRSALLLEAAACSTQWAT